MSGLHTGWLQIFNIKYPAHRIGNFCYKCFCSESWDAKEYATDYDKTRPFFEQLNEFLIKVPKINLGMSTGDGENINTEYANMVGGCKNCYLVFNTSPAEELLYSRGIKNGNFSSDIYFAINNIF